MARPRKTARIQSLVDRANRMIANADTPEERYAIGLFLHGILHDADAYAGFRYSEGHEAVLRDEYDDSKRHYYGGTPMPAAMPEWNR